MRSEYVVGITGASGSIYGVRIVEELVKNNFHVHVVVTSAGKKVMEEEIGTADFLGAITLRTFKKDSLKIWENDDFTAPFMSGSNSPEAVIIIPCSVGKLAAIANGISTNLLERTADVALKEQKPLILVVRETPFSLIHLENMVTVAKAGARILPAMPAFYHHPKTVDDMINFVIGKVFAVLNIDHALFRKWKKK